MGEKINERIFFNSQAYILDDSSFREGKLENVTYFLTFKIPLNPILI